MSTDRANKSERHHRFAAEHPSEPAPWQKPCERPAFGGCVCALGLEHCTCAPDTQPAVHIEPPEPGRMDKDARGLAWSSFCFSLGVPAGVAFYLIVWPDLQYLIAGWLP